jgi:MFS family permease
MSMAMLISYVLIGLLATRLARRGISTLHLMVSGMAMSLLTLLLIITQATDHHYALWVAYGLFSSFGTLSYAQTAAGFPVVLSGRANTSYNLMAFIGAFVLQWGMGGIIDLRHALSCSEATGYRDAFDVLFVVQASAYIWLLVSGEKLRKF